MTQEEIDLKRQEEFEELLKRTKDIKNIWEIYASSGTRDNKNTDEKISENIYVEQFLMSSILDSFLFRESLNLKELFEIVLSHKIPQSFLWNIPAKKINSTILEMIKLGYIELYRGEITLVPILQLTKVGIKTLQERTLQNLALTSFYSYQSEKLNKRAINMSLLALYVSVASIIITIMLSVIFSPS